MPETFEGPLLVGAYGGSVSVHGSVCTAAREGRCVRYG